MDPVVSAEIELALRFHQVARAEIVQGERTGVDVSDHVGSLGRAIGHPEFAAMLGVGRRKEHLAAHGGNLPRIEVVASAKVAQSQRAIGRTVGAPQAVRARSVECGKEDLAANESQPNDFSGLC